MFLYITTFVVLLVMLYIVSTHPEQFSDVPLLILQVTRSPLDITIDNASDTDLKALAKVDHVVKDHIEKSVKCTDCHLFVTDFFKVLNSPKPMKLIAVLPTEKTFVFVKAINLYKGETMKDVFTANKTVGYLDAGHKRLLQYIALSCGVRNPKLVYLRKPDFKAAYCMFYLREIEHTRLTLPAKVIPDVLEIGDYDINFLKTFLPYVLIKNKDFQKHVEGYLDRYSIKTCLVFENLLVGEAQFNNKKYEPIISNIHIALNDMPKMNFYASFTNIVETFSNGEGSVNLRVKGNLAGFYDSGAKTLMVFSDVIEGIPMKKGDKVTLKRQDRSEENGEYSVAEANGRYTLLKEGTLPSFIKDRLDKYVCIGDRTKVTQRDCERGSGIWDRPCEQNIECPFYQKNKHYKNYRGGCIDGKCELPVGVKPRGFRGYDPTTRPLCYGCLIEKPNCCAGNANPDYVFSLDSFERLSDMGVRSWH